MEEVCAAFQVWVGHLNFRWEEGGVVPKELGGFEDCASELGSAKL